MTDPATPHSWRFFRAGGFDQVLLESGDDLRNLANLDQKLWVALSCPATGVQCDKRTLELIDTDGDGQIRAPELLSAIDWTAKRLTSLDLLLTAPAALPLAAIDQTSDEGRSILASAREILKNLGRDGADAISLEDAIDSETIFAGTGFNGDGVITTLSTDDPWLQEWIERIMATVGTRQDRSGASGIDADGVGRFAEAAASWHAWRLQGEALPAAAGLPDSAAACQLWERLAPKIEDYFIRCRLAAFDQRATETMNSPEAELLALGARNLADSAAEVAALPLSRVTPTAVLRLDTGVNPAWQAELDRLTALVVVPLLGPGVTITAAQWEELKTVLAPLAQWWHGRSVSPVTDLEPALLQEWHERDVAGRLNELIARDLELSGEAAAIIEVETLLHYVRYLATLLNNFVSFRDFYTKKGVGMFQCGTLYIDGRSCELCIPVADPAKHATLATLSRLYLVYCDCVRRGGSDKLTIAAAITNGDADQIIVGRNGLFYDYNGDDWDATVVRIIDHPISLRQAFWQPYKKLGRMVGEQIQKMAAARSRAAEERALVTALHTIDKKPDAKPAPPPQLFDVGKFAGIFAAIGLAVGALGSAIATTLTGFLRLQWWQMPLAIAGLLLIVSGPAMIIAWFKLRQRNLGPILDANGWAINARAKLNIPFGASLTALARLPEGSRQQLTDPFADKKSPWPGLLLAGILLAIGIFIWLTRFH